MIFLKSTFLRRPLQDVMRYYSAKCAVPVRVRFAPSPTGQLHVGGLRTALFNYMFAKSHKGTFILRIEDTDQTRLVPGAKDKLTDMLLWAGIQIDEGPDHGGEFGPYTQSERLPLYHQHTKRLVETGKAYPCFCTEKRLELLRKSQLQRRETPRYDNGCRHLSSQEVAEYTEKGVPYVVRFKLEEYTEAWPDIVFGPIKHDVASVESDPVLLKSDGYPTYHLANVVDDHLMEISHVLRGEEWLASTTKHHLLYQAFGWSPPQFAHFPSIVNQDGKKLSKRQNDMHVEYLKEQGYAPEVLVNWLCHMSSGFTIEQQDLQGLSMEELVRSIDLKRINTHGARLDFIKLENFSKDHLVERYEKEKTSVIREIQDLVKRHFIDRSEKIEELSLNDEVLDKRLRVILRNKRIGLLKELLNPEWHFLWCSNTNIAATDLLSHHKDAYTILNCVTNCLACTQESDLDNFGALLKDLAKTHGFKVAHLMKLSRLALYGQQTGPSIVELLEILGKEVALQRLRNALAEVDTRSEETSDCDIDKLNSSRTGSKQEKS